MVTKGEIAHDEPFLLLSWFVQKSSAAVALKCVYKLESAKNNTKEKLVPGVL